MFEHQISPPNPNDLAIHVSSYPIPGPNLETEPMNLTEKASEEKNKMTVEKAKYKIKTFENQIKQLNKIDTRTGVCFSTLCI